MNRPSVFHCSSAFCEEMLSRSEYESINKCKTRKKKYICGSLPKISVTATKGTYESHNRLRNHQQDLWELCIKSCIMFLSSDLGFLEYLGSLGRALPGITISASCQVTLGLMSIHGWNEKHTKNIQDKKSGNTHTQKKHIQVYLILYKYKM